MPTPFPKEFRDDVVHVTLNRDAGVTLAQIARDFGIHVGTLDKWMRQARTEADEQSGVTTSAHASSRIAETQPAAGRARQVLRRAAYLSRANLPGKGSTAVRLEVAGLDRLAG